MIAQRNGSKTQIAARIAIKKTVAFPRRLELVHKRLRISWSLPGLLDSFAHLLEKHCNNHRGHNQIENAHGRAAAEVKKLDSGEIIHDAEKLGARTGTAAGQGEGQAKGL